MIPAPLSRRVAVPGRDQAAVPRNRRRSARPHCRAPSPARWPSPERGNISAHHSGSPMRNAIPAEISTAGACGSMTSGASRQACKSSPAARLDPSCGKPQPGSRGSRILQLDLARTMRRRTAPRYVAAIRIRRAAGGDLALGHDRPVLDTIAHRRGGSCCGRRRKCRCRATRRWRGSSRSLALRAWRGRWRRCRRFPRQSR